MLKAKTVYETINFERGLDPKDAMGIGAVKSIELPVYDIDVVDNKLNIDDENTKYFIKHLKKHNIKYKVIDFEFDGNCNIKFTGLTDDLIQLFVLFDAHGRSYTQLKKVFKNWDGDPKIVFKELF